MIDAILRGLIVGGSAYAGARMGEKYLSGGTETPVWTGHLGGDVGKAAVSLTRVAYRGLPGRHRRGVARAKHPATAGGRCARGGVPAMRSGADATRTIAGFTGARRDPTAAQEA